MDAGLPARSHQIAHTDFAPGALWFRDVPYVDCNCLHHMLVRARVEGKGLYLVPGGNHLDMAFLIETEATLRLVLRVAGIKRRFQAFIE